eukprot:10090744-Alexandrium_andersonii.AAC.1
MQRCQELGRPHVQPRRFAHIRWGRDCKCLGRFWARAVQASSASSRFRSCSRIGELRRAPRSSVELRGALESSGELGS